MDEPLGALDLKLREALQFEIKEIQHQLGCTVVYVTHDQREALAMSSRIVVLRNGRIEQVGTPTEMYDHPQTRFIADFIGQTNLLQATVSGDGTVALPALGVSYAGTGGDWAPGDCFASIRPEKLERRQAGAGEIGFPVIIHEAVFLGDVVEYSAEHASGTLFYFREQRGSFGSIADRGAEVPLAFRTADAVLVRAS